MGADKGPRVLTAAQFSKTTLASFKQLGSYAGGTEEAPGDFVTSLTKEAEHLFESYGETLFAAPTMLINTKNRIQAGENKGFISSMKGIGFYMMILVMTGAAVVLSTAKHAFSPPEDDEKEANDQ